MFGPVKTFGTVHLPDPIEENNCYFVDFHCLFCLPFLSTGLGTGSPSLGTGWPAGWPAHWLVDGPGRFTRAWGAGGCEGG